MSIALQTSYSQNPNSAVLGQTRTGAKTTTMKNADSVSMPIGGAVCQKTSSPTTDLDVVLPGTIDASTGKVEGIVAHEYDYAPYWTDAQGNAHGQLDSTGIVAGESLSVVREGWVWVTCFTGCAPGDRLYVSFAAGSTYTAANQLGNVTDTNVIDATTKGEWKSTATAGNPAWLEMHAYAK